MPVSLGLDLWIAGCPIKSGMTGVWSCRAGGYPRLQAIGAQ
ncbi:hypothetical protein [Limnohabitans sp. T6-20]|nr:hypothetical protein [Limnohabitans sp. T6-20]